jgi:putative Ca2+/H+ antiporter (TMEM165/GDT1 family)
MTGFFEIVLIAAVAQLTVLPGEKVQFIIAGLSTRYKPLVVVGAAGSAFAGWTALEILFGQALQRALPGVVLDAMTAGLFLLFAVLLVRSAPEASSAAEAATEMADGGSAGVGPDAEASSAPTAGTEAGGGIADGTVPDIAGEFEIFGRTVGGSAGRFLSIFSMMAAGEFGDKTQLITIGLAAQYGATPAIWVGEMLAIIPVSLANAYFFHRFAHKFDLRKAHFFGAALFAFFGLDTVLAITTGFSVWERLVGTVSQLVLSLL